MRNRTYMAMACASALLVSSPAAVAASQYKFDLELTGVTFYDVYDESNYFWNYDPVGEFSLFPDAWDVWNTSRIGQTITGRIRLGKDEDDITCIINGIDCKLDYFDTVDRQVEGENVSIWAYEEFGDELFDLKFGPAGGSFYYTTFSSGIISDEQHDALEFWNALDVHFDVKNVSAVPLPAGLPLLVASAALFPLLRCLRRSRASE